MSIQMFILRLYCIEIQFLFPYCTKKYKKSIELKFTRTIFIYYLAPHIAWNIICLVSTTAFFSMFFEYIYEPKKKKETQR